MLYMSVRNVPGIKCQTSVHLALIKVKELSQSYREFTIRSNKDQVLMASCGLAAYSHLITLKFTHIFLLYLIRMPE